MDVICLGELLVDMFAAELGRNLGEVSAFHPKPGGAPANVAVSLARLGVQSAFVGKVGDDAFGRHLALVLAEEGVDITGIRYDSEARTTLAFVARPDPDNAQFLFYRNPGADTRLRSSEIDRQFLSQARILHFGSLSLVEPPIKLALNEAIEIVRDAGGMISLDVNYRPTLWKGPKAAYEEVTAILPDINLLKVNEDELALLSGSRDLEVGSQILLDSGPDAVVVTLGAEGSYFRTRDDAGHIKGYAVETIDSTGCGDAFIAGVLSQMLDIEDWKSQLSRLRMISILRYGNAVGALTATKEGVIPALPTREAVHDFLATN